MSTLEDKLAAGIAQVKNTSRTRKTPAKVAPEASVPAALSADSSPAAIAASVKTTEPEVTLAVASVPTQVTPTVIDPVPKRIYLTDDRVWPD